MDHELDKRSMMLRWLLPSIAVLFIGPLLSLPVAGLRGPTGGTDATLLLSSSPVVGVLALIALAVVAGAGGAITARLTAPGTGRTFVGLCVAWTALRTANSWRLYEMHGGGAAIPLAIEGVLVGVVAAVIALMLALGGGTHTREKLASDLRIAVASPNAAIGIAIGVAAGIGGSVLVALDGARGQCVAGGFAGALLAAVAVHLATPTLTTEQARLRSIAAVIVLMVVAPLTIMVMPGAGEAAQSARAGTLVGPALVQPLDWLVGVFLGIPTGLGWVGSVSEKAHQPTPARRATR